MQRAMQTAIAITSSDCHHLERLPSSHVYSLPDRVEMEVVEVRGQGRGQDRGQDRVRMGVSTRVLYIYIYIYSGIDRLG